MNVSKLIEKLSNLQNKYGSDLDVKFSDLEMYKWDLDIDEVIYFDDNHRAPYIVLKTNES